MNNYFNLGIGISNNMKAELEKMLKTVTIIGNPFIKDNYIVALDNADFLVDEIKLTSDIYLSLVKDYKLGEDFKLFCKHENLDPILHSDNIFKQDKMYIHQQEATKRIKNFQNTIISTGTGSGKTESFMIPIIDYCLKNTNKKGIKAIIIYPMNALANDQVRRVSDMLASTDLSFAIFTGETPTKDKDIIDDYPKNQLYYREDIIDNTPDILITNHIMLDRIITNKSNSKLIEDSSNSLKYVVIDEIHTFKGNKASHIRFLLDRLKYEINNEIVHVGCSATLSSNSNEDTEDANKFIKDLFNISIIDDLIINATYKELELVGNDIENYEDINKIKIELYKESKSISELIEILDNKYDYNEIIDFLNKNLNYITFKTNLFIKNIKDGVKRCINCGTYHLGLSSKCMKCSYPLFYISCSYKDVMIGRIDTTKKIISNDIKSKGGNLVALAFDDNELKCNDLKCISKISIELSHQSEVKVEYKKDKFGKVNIVDVERFEPMIFNIQKSYDPIREVLMNLEKNKKVLVFIDSRKGVSKSKNEFNDATFESCLFAISRISNFKSLSLSKYKNNLKLLLKGYIERYDKNNIKINDYVKPLLESVDLWFERFIRGGSTNSILSEYDYFKDYKPYFELAINNTKITQHEKILIHFLLSNYIFDSESVRKESEYIRYRVKRLKNIKIVTTSEDGEELKYYEKISLSKRARKISYFIQSNYPQNANDEFDFDKILRSLNDKEILNEIHINKKLTGYNLNREAFNINLNKTFIEEDFIGRIDKILKNNLYLSQSHSSEINKDLKNEYEKKFMNEDLNVLYSTPTLEMGIDIGGLNVVFLQGVPPNASNFTQRAGRAGRHKDKTALIITICNDFRYHDAYYFDNPKDMINGSVLAPRFKDDNFNLMKKHINAFIYKNDCEDKEELLNEIKHCFVTDNQEIEMKIEKLLISRDYENYENLKKKNLDNLYKSKEFPDYSFRKDNIKVYSHEYLNENGYSKVGISDNDDKKKQKYELSYREPELCYKEYIPFETKYMSGDMYKLLSVKGTYKQNNLPIDRYDDMSSDLMRIYNEFYAIENIGKSRESISDKVYDTREHIYPASKTYKEEYEIIKDFGIIEMKYANKVGIEYINNGYIDENGGVKPFFDEDTKENFIIGQQLKRPALIFKKEDELISNDAFLSFINALMISILDYYGLDTNEINFVWDKSKSLFAIFDSIGNDNLELEDVLKNNDSVLNYTLKKLENCKCEELSGCYLCMKSYGMSVYSNNINKKKAINIIKYILGEERLNIEIKPPTKKIAFDKKITVRAKGSRVFATVDNEEFEYFIEKDKTQNETIFNSLISVLENIDEQKSANIKIVCSQEYLVNAINGEATIKQKDVLERFLKSTYRFENVKAFRG